MDGLGSRILCISPHLDDEVIGCGGVLALARDKRLHVCVVYLTEPSGDGEEIAACRTAEALKVGNLLNLSSQIFLGGHQEGLLTVSMSHLISLARIIREFRPDTIFCPHNLEEHCDHQIAHELTVRSIWLAGVGVHKALIGNSKHRPHRACFYEVWTPLPRSNRIIDISNVVEQKRLLIGEYKSQLRGRRYDLSAEGLAKYRAISCGLPATSFAEAYLEVCPSKLGYLDGKKAFFDF